MTKRKDSLTQRLQSLTFDCVSEAFGGGGVIGRCVKSVDLQTVCHILGLWETLDHRPVDVPCRVPSDGRRLRAWEKTQTRGTLQPFLCTVTSNKGHFNNSIYEHLPPGAGGGNNKSYCCRWFPVCRSPLRSRI